MNIPLGRIFGTEIRAHWTWIPILAFIAVVFGLDLTTGGGSDWPVAVAWAASISTAALVFLSVVTHELAHVGIARRSSRDAAPSELPKVVVVQLLGGTFVMESRPRTPGQELKTALAGPAVSLLVVAVLAAFVGFLAVGPINLDNAPAALQAVQFVALMIAVFNAFLAFVNLIPGYPMDGARVVHAVVWRKTGNEAVGSDAAIRVGRYVGGTLMVAGVVMVIFGADFFAGLALLFAGWLVMQSSRMLGRRALFQRLVAGMRAADAVDPDQATVPPQLTLDVFAAEYLGERAGTAALVERGEELIGLIGTAQIRRIARRTWNNIRTEDAMVPIAKVPRIPGETDLWASLELLDRTGLDGLLLVPGGDGPTLMTRRSAARIVQEKARLYTLETLATGQRKRGRFLGR
jgi:Zn-dependent protease